MVESTKLFFTNYFNASGRTSRRHFWLAILGIFLIEFAIGVVGGFVCGFAGVDQDTSIMIEGVLSLLIFIPVITIQIRRLHDINKSGWWLLLDLIGIGAIILFVFFCLPSVDSGNKYGARDN